MNKSFIRIKAGAYRNQDVSGKVFQLVEQYKKTAKGGYVTVVNGNNFPGFPEAVRIKVDSVAAYEFLPEGDFMQAGGALATVPVVQQESEEDAIVRIRERFEVLTEMATACANGEIRAMVVSGPPGVGKSYGVEKVVEKSVLFDKVSGKRCRAEVISGGASAIGLYQTLYKYSDKNCLVVFDDCDSILWDEQSLGLLKGALNTGKNRRISWLGESAALRRDGIPDAFDFHGSVIFITNLKFDNMRQTKLKDHMDAFLSRCHYLDLTLDTMRDKLLRIKQVSADGELFEDYGFTKDEEAEVFAFLETHQSSLREMSCRMAIKVADLRKVFPSKWQARARVTCMRGQAA